MINSVKLNNFGGAPRSGLVNSASGIALALSDKYPQTKPIAIDKNSSPALTAVPTKLTTEEENKMYLSVLNAFATSQDEKISPQDNVLRQNKLDALLKNGVLLSRNSNDNSSVLENVYKTIQTPRGANLDGVKIAGQIIDALYDPAIINQQFGDIPTEAMDLVKGKEVSQVDVNGSSTCAAASVEGHMANKHPAEFARWAQALTSPSMSVEQNVNLTGLSKNTMDAIWLLDQFEVDVKDFNFVTAKLNLKPDENAVIRAQIQDKYWDKGERSVLDVLFQSTLMQTASQQSYDSLTDKRAGKFNTNPLGLIEFEKTFIESIVENAERTSVVYLNVDQNQVITGRSCPLEETQKNITDALDSGEDVIIGYVLTAQECGIQAQNPNQIANGHEITIVDYKKDENGNITFVCNDTDDNKAEFIEYEAQYLLPRIHHAGFAVDIVGE